MDAVQPTVQAVRPEGSDPERSSVGNCCGSDGSLDRVSGGPSASKSGAPERAEEGTADAAAAATSAAEAGSQATPGASKRRCCGAVGRKGNRRACAVAVLCALVVVGTLAVLLWPRDPVWEVQTISVDPSDVTGVIQAFTDVNFSTAEAFPVNSTARIYNRNFLGAETGSSQVIASFRGQQVAEVEVEPITIPARGSAIITARSVSFITPELSAILMEAVLPTFTLTVDIHGTTPLSIPALLGLALKSHMSCTVEVNVLAIVQDPNKMVTGHKCKYSVGF